MRRAAALLLVTLGAAAGWAERAAPPGPWRAGASEPPPAEAWVGTWRGAARWRDCSAEGDARLAVAVRWRDGGLWLDGASAYEGLGELPLAAGDGAALVHDGDGAQVALAPATRRGARTATLTLTTAAQCRLEATLRRDGTGIAACDDLAGLAAIAGACGLPVVAPAAAAPSPDGGAPTSDGAPAPDAAACRRDGAALRARLEAADCLASADSAADLPACREVWTAAAVLVQCPRVPAEVQRSTTANVAELRRSLKSLRARKDGDALAAQHCGDAAEILRDTARLLGCR